MNIIFSITMFILGACVGSFLCCQARRLIYRKEKNKSTTKKKKLGKRSVCLHCGKQLKVYENIPIFSWLFLKGKCRKCGKKIGLAEFLSEIGLALAFVGLSTTINITTTIWQEWAIFVCTILVTTSLAFLAIYDGITGKLPTKCLIVSICLATLLLAFKIWYEMSLFGFSTQIIIFPLASVLILGGLYFFLYKVSKGKWVGDGDWILGTAVALALFNPWLALITLFLANLLACLIMAPLIKKQKNKKVHFGPFMVMAYVIVITFTPFLLSML